MDIWTWGDFYAENTSAIMKGGWWILDKTAKKICAFILGLTALTGFAVGYETRGAVMRRKVFKVAGKILEAVGNAEVHTDEQKDESTKNEEES